jgi:hypothetical protein
MPPAPVGFSLDESARRVGGFRWLETRYFEILGAWVPTVAEPDVKLMLARHSAHNGWHAELLADCLPATKDHDPDAVTVAPSPALAAVVDTVAATAGTAERLVAVYQVLTPEKVAALERMADAANPVADGAVRRVLRIVLLDEVDHLTEGLAAVEGLVAAGAVTPDAAATARDRFAALLVEAGAFDANR